MSSSTTVGEAKISLRFDQKGLSGDMKSTEKAVTTFSERLKSTTAGILSADTIQKGLDSLKNGIMEVAKTGIQFESSMAKVKAISGATGAEFEKLQAKARELGKNSVFSASESAEAFNYMSMAGWGTADMLDGIEGVMNLAAASGTDLATTSDIVTDALTAMGYSAKDSSKFADVLAATSANANTNVRMMGESFKYAAPIAGALGYTIEDTSVALGMMSNSGIKAEQAGTSLRSILTRLASPTKDVQKTMDALGVSLKDDKGNMRALNDVMKDLRKGFSNLSATQKAEAAESIAGKNAMTGLLAIVNATESDFSKLTTAVNNSTGAAKKMADTMNNTVDGKMKLLKSHLEEIYLTIWEKLTPSVSKALEKVEEALNRVDWDAVGETIGKAFSTLIDALSWILEHTDLVASAMQVMIAAMSVKKITDFGDSVASTAEKIGGMAKKVLDASPTVESFGDKIAKITAPAVQSLSTSLAAVAAPAAAVTAGVTGIAAIMIGVSNALNDYEKSLDNSIGSHARMKESLDKSQVSLKKSRDEWQKLKEKQAEAISAGAQELNYYERLAKELDLIVDENGKVKSGYEDRVQFITTQLSNALGIEIKYAEGIVTGYQDIRDNITKTIEAKKAELVLASQEEIYKKALEGRIEIVKQIREATEQQRLAEEQGREEDRLKIAQHITELQGQYEQYTLSIGQYENNMALYSEGKYKEMSQTIHEYSDQYKNAEEAVKATLLDEVLNTTSELGALKTLHEQTGDEIYLKQIETAQAQLEAKKDEMQKYFGSTEEYLVKTTEAWDKNLEQQLSAVTGRKVEFHDAGNGLVTMMIDGIVAKENMTKEAMSELTRQTVNEVHAKRQDALNAGTNLIEGVNEGLLDPKAQAKAFDTVTRFGQGVEGTLRRTWEEHSPSRIAEDDGRNLIYGVGNGIGNSHAQGGVFGAISSFASSIVARFRNSLGIHSPSKVMQDVIGKNIPAGIGVGFDNEMDKVEKDMTERVSGLASDVYSEIPEFDYSMSTMANTLLKSTLDDEITVKNENEQTRPKEPLIVNLQLDGRQIQQVILQDIRRTA